MRVAAGLSAIVGVFFCGLVASGFLLLDYYRLRPFLLHPVIFGVAGCVALALAWGLGIRQPVVKWLGVVLIVVVGVVWGGMAWFAMALAGGGRGHESQRLPSPNGDMEMVVFSGGGITIDPITSVQVYTDRGLLSRENYLGCVNGEHDGLKAVEWTGPRTVRVELLRGGTTTITLDDRGRPDQTISC
ncbi:hypothetical protein [Mycolicibacterium fortuitum]|uniref:Uncharacterized protein n=2 Tax=Mycolicibacterium fortuitum TaxID=1766 RepID=A0AAE5AA36_MYCFO|nr:hypothetical protein [Mycolicibacterium fortuitum]AIY45252.2 hypothetical protein G155_06350 [Mycobacterium sp. VKM Ac-1817D]CRL80478.1 hypothetical protein CPGR_03681 [Mycolicibacter nonchromogenicus]MCA4721562.1 hypothetical protein [Mycolicibacterium fortuitum]MCV7144144.1 hypothetical protein [Mycolicibacterium fortuitum]MDV7188896.1 hypothetical protein [Mycolicibacterium fortuitum]